MRQTWKGPQTDSPLLAVGQQKFMEIYVCWIMKRVIRVYWFK